MPRVITLTPEVAVPGLAIGVVLLLVWGVLQFGVDAGTGWIHLLLIAGVLLVIRGIALRGEREGTG
jgi:hypothetical protein